MPQPLHKCISVYVGVCLNKFLHMCVCVCETQVFIMCECVCGQRVYFEAGFHYKLRYLHFKPEEFQRHVRKQEQKKRTPFRMKIFHIHAFYFYCCCCQ